MRKSSDPPLEKGCCDKTLLGSASVPEYFWAWWQKVPDSQAVNKSRLFQGRDSGVISFNFILHTTYRTPRVFLNEEKAMPYSTLDLEHQTVKPLFQAQPEAQNAFSHRIAFFIISSMGTYSSALQRSKQQPL